MKSVSRIVRVLAVAATASIFSSALAQEFPQRPVRIVVPFSPGGATDALARLVAANLTSVWAQPTVVENKPGASGNIGAEQVAAAPADGHTLLMATSNHAINATLYTKLRYSLTQDFTPVTRIAQVPLVLVVHPGVKARSVAELVSLGKASPGSLSYASGSTGTASHLAGHMFAEAADIKAIHIAYKGGAPAINDLLAGHVPMMFANMPEVLPLVRSGKLVALAVTSAERHPALSNTPTLAESGFPRFEAMSWFGLLLPKATPTAVVVRIHRDLTAVLKSPEVSSKLAEQGALPVIDSETSFASYVRAEVDKWGRLVRASGATTD